MLEPGYKGSEPGYEGIRAGVRGFSSGVLVPWHEGMSSGIRGLIPFASPLPRTLLYTPEILSYSTMYPGRF